MSVPFAVMVFVGCLFALAKVADMLLDGVMVIAARLKMSQAVAGATLAAIATSAPELGTNVAALAIHDASTSDIGVGTIIGSAVFNVAAIIGVVALTGATKIGKRVIRRELLVYAISVAALLVAVMFVGHATRAVSRIEAMAMLLGYGGYVWWIWRDVRRGHAKPVEGGDDGIWRALAKLLGSIGAIALACHFLVSSASVLIHYLVPRLGMQPRAVTSVASIVVIAAATSVPDAATSLAAARRGAGSLAVANAIGSNTFDILVCLGLPYAALGGSTISRPIVWASWYLLGTVVLLFLLARGRRLRKLHGVALVAMYGLFVALVIGVSLIGLD